jgi:CDP-diacylglycerol---glycerol-3-phosphate 3-phosphatidyltransferase
VTGSLVSPATRQRVRDLATPIATALGRLGLTPNALTLIGFVGTCAAGIAAGVQQWLAAGILVLAFGIFDLFDGTLARATGRATKLGAFLDSTFDRAGEGIVYIGIAAGTIAAGFAPGAALAVTALAAASMVPYTRAKAEGLGFSTGTGMAAVGLAPREVRVALLSIGLILTSLVQPFVRPEACTQTGPDTLLCIYGLGNSPLTGSAVLASTLGMITILATITTIQRILHVRAQSREG